MRNLGLDITPRENFMLSVRHEEPYWLPCPMFDASFVSFSHGLIEHCDHGKDSWGVTWELKDLRSDSFPGDHPLHRPDEVDDYPFPSVDTSQIIKKAKEKASQYDQDKVVFEGYNGWGLFEKSMASSRRHTKVYHLDL